MVVKKNMLNRLSKYSAAAVAAAATGMVAADAEADLVSITGLSLGSSNSVEGFLDIQGFAAGASTFGYQFALSSFSGANPLGGTATDMMIRGVFAPATGTAQISPRNGALAAFQPYAVSGPYNTGTYLMAENVGSAFNPASGGAIYAGGGTYANYLVTWPWNNSPGGFSSGNGTVAFQFVNPNDSNTYQGWLDLAFGDDGSGNFEIEITGIHVDTGAAIPEPTSAMALLCMGAAGLGTYRRRRKAA